MNKPLLFFLLSSLFQLTYGQYQIGIIPRVSPDRATYQKIGYTEVEVRYGSPSVQDREIWGELVPYGKVWRAGANSATTLALSTPIQLQGMTLDSGTYSFFVIPKAEEPWTIIFNKIAKQWGAFRYKKEEDALRIEVQPRMAQHKVENLSYTLLQEGFTKGSILLAWDSLELEIPFETNYFDQFERTVEARANAQPDYIKWIPYIQGAEHLEQMQTRKEVAKRWMQMAEELMQDTQEWRETFYARSYVEGHLYWIKAKVLAWDNNYEEALQYIEKLKGLEGSSFYQRQNEIVGIDAHSETWKKK